MDLFLHLLTSAIFASHALLGCGVHHICQHARGTIDVAAHRCAHHAERDCHHEDSTAPDDGDSCPRHSCEHASCSFVKADTVRIEQGERTALCVAAPVDALQTTSWPALRATTDLSRAHHDAAPLYVWHCALVI